jgi:DNA polymerase-1
MYRAFFALPDSITDAAGVAVNALLGATNATLRIAADRAPRAIVMCFGAEAAHYRVAAYPAYHADRPPVPDTLQPQLDAIGDWARAFGWEVAETAGLEADDLLHAFARAETAAGGSVLLMTGDRDLFQCAADDVTVLYLKTGVKGFEELGPAEVEARYGVPPALVPDFIALRGDPSDGLPGAKGIGEKTAADLLRRHGSLEGAIAAAAGEKPRVAAALQDQADELRTFKDIALLRDTAVTPPADRVTDLVGGAAAARARGMGRLAARLEQSTNVADL